MHVVGHGPLSRVYKAVWNNEVIAVKIYASSSMATTKNARNLVTNEIEIWKKLQNPNILEFTSKGMTNGDPENEAAMKVEFAISPFFPHGNVSSYLRQMQWNYDGMASRPERFDERRIFFDVAKGMMYLHSRRILHGNLKVCLVFLKQTFK